MKLEEIMSKKVVTISARESANAAWSKMQQRRIRHLIVTENKQLVGVLSQRDLGGRNGSVTRRGRTVQDLMTSRIATVEPGTSLRQAANLMRGRLIGCLPVLEEDRLVGIVTATDVLDALGRGQVRPEPLMRRVAVGRLNAAKRKSVGRPITRNRRRQTRRGREHHREPNSEDRTPFAGQIPRAVRARSGRTSASLVPTFIFDVTSKIDANDKDYIRRKLGMKLGKFAHSIKRVSVRIEDINGTRGGIDQLCRIRVVLAGLPSITVEAQGQLLQAAMDNALSRVERAVRKQLQRRRQKPLRRSSRQKRSLAA